MSIEAVALVKRHAFGSVHRKAVMLVLADYCDAQLSCFVGQERLAWESEVSERAARGILAEFAGAGLIRRDKRYGGVRGRTSDRITLVREAIETLPAYAAGRSDLPAPGDDLPAPGDRSTGTSYAGEPLGNGKNNVPRQDNENEVTNHAEGGTPVAAALAEARDAIDWRKLGRHAREGATSPRDRGATP